VVCEADVEAGGKSKASKVLIFGLGVPAVEVPVEMTQETTDTVSDPDEKEGSGIPASP
jgi:hypothetical protein